MLNVSERDTRRQSEAKDCFLPGDQTRRGPRRTEKRTVKGVQERQISGGGPREVKMRASWRTTQKRELCLKGGEH